MRTELWNIYNRKCGICGRFMRLQDVTLDHIYPKSLGGINHKDNFQPAHRICNQLKADTIPKLFKLRKDLLQRVLS